MSFSQLIPTMYHKQLKTLNCYVTKLFLFCIYSSQHLTEIMMFRTGEIVKPKTPTLNVIDVLCTIFHTGPIQFSQTYLLQCLWKHLNLQTYLKSFAGSVDEV